MRPPGVASRMIAIADLFDALTAADHRYKRAVSADRALDNINRAEPNAGRLDRDLVRIVIESRIYPHILETDWDAALSGTPSHPRGRLGVGKFQKSAPGRCVHSGTAPPADRAMSH